MISIIVSITITLGTTLLLIYSWFRSKYDLKETITGKIVLVTGACSGIGKSVCVRIRELGGHLIMVSNNNERLKRAYEEISSIKVDKERLVEKYVIELGDSKNAEEITKRILERFGHVDYFFSNAGLVQTSPLRSLVSNGSLEMRDVINTSTDLIQHLMNVNLQSPIIMTKMILRRMKDERLNTNPAIIFTGCFEQYIPVSCASVYGCAKAGLSTFSSFVGAEAARWGIRVICVFPSYVKTSAAMDAMYGEVGRRSRKRFQFVNGVLDSRTVAERMIVALARNESGAIYIYSGIFEWLYLNSLIYLPSGLREWLFSNKTSEL
ncbi:hypothetical protein ACOME3_002300 [Neoechinorhynchus agilis]